MNIANYDIQTLISILFWGNLACLILVCAYILYNKNITDWRQAQSIIVAKTCLTISFLLLGYDNISDFLRINVSSTFLLIGFLAEARSMFTVLGEGNGKLMKLVLGIALLSMLVFNHTAILYPNSAIRITVVSFGVALILVIPTMRLIFAHKSTSFKRVIGIFYLVYIALLLPRGLYFIASPEYNVFTRSQYQGLSYTSLIFLTIFSLSAFLLLLKEDADSQLRKMAHTDFLTGLYNRQYFLNSVTIPFARNQREKGSCSVMFMDIDHFKQVNDTFGHSFGDKVLVMAASAFREVMREYELLCRYGGEEFAAFIENTHPEDGQVVAERIRNKISEISFPEQPEFKFTISIGIATGVPRHGDTIVEFINKADESLYETKETGRNRVVERRVEFAHGC